MTPAELGRELREGSGKFLRRRRGIVGLNLLSSAVLGGIALYQIGILKNPGFGAGKVDGSAQAYSIPDVPDGPLGMGLKVLGDAAFAGKLTVDECRNHHAFSLGSLITAGAAFAAVPLAVPEVKTAIRHLKRVQA